MCDTSVYVVDGQSERMLLESLDTLRVEGGELYMKSIFGEEKRVAGRIREISLKRHRVVIEQA